MGCAPQAEICIIRGDVWSMDVGLSSQWTEVIADPGGFVGTIVLRDEQDDTAVVRLQLQATPKARVDPSPGAPPLRLSFAATAGQTQQLPDYNIVGYCQLASIDATDQSRRLFNLKVQIDD